MTNLYSDRWINVSYIISNSVHGNILNKMFTIKKYICQRSAHADNCFKHKNEQKQSDIGFQLIRSDRTVRGNEQSWEERKGKKSKTKSNQVLTVSEWEKYQHRFCRDVFRWCRYEKTSTGPAADQWIVQKTAVWQAETALFKASRPLKAELRSRSCYSVLDHKAGTFINA